MKHTLLYVLLFFTVLSVLALPCLAEDMSFSGVYTDVYRDIESLCEFLPERIDNFSGIFGFTGDNIWNVKRKFNDTSIVSVNPGTGKRGYVSYNFDAIPAMLEYDTLVFGMHIAADTDAETGQTAQPYRVMLDVLTGDGIKRSHVYVEPNIWTMVYFDIGWLGEAENFEALHIMIEYIENEVPDRVEMTSLSADNIAGLLEAYNAGSVIPDEGSLAFEDGALHLIPDTSGRVSVSMRHLLEALPEDAEGLMLSVTLAEGRGSGSLTAGMQYTNYDEIFVTSPMDLSADQEVYLFPLPFPDTADIMATDELDTLYLYFHDSEAVQDEEIILTSLVLYPIPAKPLPTTPLPDTENLGTILSFGIAEEEIVFAGKLSRNAVIRYIDDTIQLYAVPVWDNRSMDSAVLLGECGISNSYTISLPLSAYRSYAENWMFFLAISHRDPDDPDNRILYMLNEPKLLTGHAPAPSTLSILGLHNANTVGVFESNVSHVVVDIPLDQLLTKNGSTVCSRSGKSWHLNTALLTELDSEIQFYADAGLEVCLRLFSDKPIAGLTYMSHDAETYLPYLHSEEAIEQYTAIVSFLSRRYPAMDSIMLGGGINSEKYTGIPMQDPVTALRHIADLTAITYTAASASVPDVYVIVPFTDDYEDDILTDTGELVPLTPEFIAMLFAGYLEDLGSIPWVFGYNFDTIAADTFALPDAVSRNLQQMGFAAPADTVFTWFPVGETQESWASTTLVQNYADLCVEAAAVQPRALYLSLKKIPQKADPRMYSAMKDIQVENSSRVIWDHPADMDGTSVLPSLSSLTLYDFSSAYSSLGWVAGGGITEMYTRHNPLFSDTEESRTLRSLLPLPEEDGHRGIAGGVLLRNFSRTLDMRDVDEITFRFALTDLAGEKNVSDSGATVIFLLGSQDRRAEFYAYTVPFGETVDARCALSEYENADRINYVGVMVYANESVVLDLSSVSVSSSVLNQNELDALFYGSEAEADDMANFTEIFYILIITMLLTICAALLLIRRDREETEAAEEQL
ncbi:MAG: hypothetical protein E7658_07360 [Ruminococcaceae bacterium]|nr:hypothetical protein [Oscillospiraceae bacterium]